MRTLWSILALAWAAALCAAATVEVGGFAYPRVAVGWASPMPAAFAALKLDARGADPALVGSLAQLDLKDPAARQSLAPVAYALSNDLHLSPEKFIAMPEADRATALALAIDQAREGLERKVQGLAAQAGEAWKVQAGDREAQAGLYNTLTALGEIRGYYGPYLSEETRELVAQSYAKADARAQEIREALLKQAGEGLAAPDGAAKKSPAPAVVDLPKPSPTAVKVLEDMRNTKSGWGLDDFRTVYKGYGFIETQGGKHVKFTHPVFPELVQHVSRGKSLAPGYAVDAVKMIDRLERLKAERGPPAQVSVQGPAEIPLSDLKFLLEKPRIEVRGKRAEARRQELKAAAREARETAVQDAPAKVVEVIKTPEPVAAAPAPVLTLQPATPRVQTPKVETPKPQVEAVPAKKIPFWKRWFGLN